MKIAPKAEMTSIIWLSGIELLVLDITYQLTASALAAS